MRWVFTLTFLPKIGITSMAVFNIDLCIVTGQGRKLSSSNQSQIAPLLLMAPGPLTIPQIPRSSQIDVMSCGPDSLQLNIYVDYRTLYVKTQHTWLYIT